MAWTVEKQKKYMVLVEMSHKEGPIRATKLRSDANLDGCIHESQYFLLQDALAEAYRAGAIDAIFGKADD
jgi:hypothetical protein